MINYRSHDVIKQSSRELDNNINGYNMDQEKNMK